MCFMEGQGVDVHVGDDFLWCFVFVSSTMVSNGVDTMRFPCSALNVKVVRHWKQARVNDRRNHDSHDGGHVCSECQSGETLKTSAGKRQE